MSRYERASLGEPESEGLLSRMRAFIEMPQLVKYLVEFGAAFALVLFVGAIEDDYKSNVITSSAYGLTTALLMLMFSAQHFNPWLTIYAFAMDLMQARTPPAPSKVFLGMLNVVSIIGVQTAGSIFGAWFLSYLHNDAQRVGVTIPADHMNAGDTIAWEFIVSFLHFMAIMCTMTRPLAEDKDPEAKNTHVINLELNAVPMAAGLSMTVASLASISRTGASVNIIRSIGPAIISGRYRHLEYIMLGQAIGYLGAGLVFGSRYQMRVKQSRRRL